METELPPTGPTIDLCGDEEEGEEEEEAEEEEEEDSLHISQKYPEDDDDEGPGHFGRSGRVVSSGAQPSQGITRGETSEAPKDK